MGLLSDYADSQGGMPGLLGYTPPPDGASLLPGNADLSQLAALLASQSAPQGGPAPGPSGMPQAAPPPQAAPQGAPQAGPAPNPSQGAPQLPPQGQAQPNGAAFAQPFKPLTGIGAFLDFGGRIEANRERQYAAQQQAIGLQNTRAMYQQIAQTEGPAMAQMFISKPDLYEKLHEPREVKAGETDVANGQSTVAPMFDSVSGKWTTPNGATPSIGGPLSASNGMLLSRDGGVAGTYSTPLTKAPQDTVLAPTPSVNLTGAPQLGAPQLPGGGGQPPAPPPPPGQLANAPQLNGGGVGDPRAFFKSFILPHEGGLNPADMNGSPTNFGINQKANPGVNVRNLTPDSAADIFAQKYYPSSGAANLPPALAAIHADTSFINPSKAKQFLAQSGGDPAKYMALRQAWMQGMVANNPAAAKYANAWSKRNADLAQYAGLGGGGPTAPAGGPAPNPAAGAPQLGGGNIPGSAPVIAGSTGGYKIVPGSQVPGGKPTWSYKIAPNGDETPIAPDFNMETVQGNRKTFYESPQYKAASDSIAPLQGMDKVVSSVAPGGVMGMAAVDTLNKSLNPGGVVRPQTVALFLDHLGLPEELKSHILGITGNGFLSPAVIKQVGQASWSYAKAHNDQASQRAQEDQQIALAHGFKPEDVGEQAPAMPPVPKWAQDQKPANPVPGKVYWTPGGPMRFNGRTYIPQ